MTLLFSGYTLFISLTHPYPSLLLEKEQRKFLEMPLIKLPLFIERIQQLILNIRYIDN